MMYQTFVNDLAKKYQLDPDLILAIINVESAGNQYATRFEPNWNYYCRPDQFARMISPPITSATERVHQATSWGLMQVMGAVAREHGFTDHLPKLCQALIGIEYGCKHLVRLSKPGRTIEDVIASYNAGSPRRTPDGKYVNQGYVDKVMAQWNKVRLRGPA